MSGVLRRRGRFSKPAQVESSSQEGAELEEAVEALIAEPNPNVLEPTSQEPEEAELVEPFELGEPVEVEELSPEAKMQLARDQAHEYGMSFIDLTRVNLSEDVIRLVPSGTLTTHTVLPIELKGDVMTLAIGDVDNVVGIDEVNHATDRKYTIKPIIAVEDEIRKALDLFLGHADQIEMDGRVQDVVHEADEEYQNVTAVTVSDAADLEIHESAPIVVRIVNLILVTAIKKGASDIHIHPEENAIRVRYRIDGVLYDAQPHSWRYGRALAARLKVMAKLDIAEKRRPQDGGISFRTGGKRYDLRVSCLPSVYGEKIVMRIAEETKRQVGLDELGFSENELIRFKSVIERPYGMILVTGPTGSGKTTTLYSVLGSLNDPAKSITTVEEPVERRLRGICQTPVQSDKRAVFTFAKALRSILRQDPDIIMVGEIRDQETADIATHAALTGHLVLTTLHTNDAPAAPPRLIDMGIEPYLVSSSVIGVLAQRLIRVLCPKCKEKYEMDPKMLSSLGVAVDNLTGRIEAWRPVGCPTCNGQGYKGRLGVFELLIMTDELRNLVATHAPADEIAAVSRSQGMVTMLEDAVSKVFTGITSIEEVMRVVDLGEGAMGSLGGAEGSSSAD